jgi:hypothetical protein
MGQTLSLGVTVDITLLCKQYLFQQHHFVVKENFEGKASAMMLFFYTSFAR